MGAPKQVLVYISSHQAQQYFSVLLKATILISHVCPSPALEMMLIIKRLLLKMVCVRLTLWKAPKASALVAVIHYSHKEEACLAQK